MYRSLGMTAWFLSPREQGRGKGLRSPAGRAPAGRPELQKTAEPGCRLEAASRLRASRRYKKGRRLDKAGQAGARKCPRAAHTSRERALGYNAESRKKPQVSRQRTSDDLSYRKPRTRMSAGRRRYKNL